MTMRNESITKKILERFLKYRRQGVECYYEETEKCIIHVYYYDDGKINVMIRHKVSEDVILLNSDDLERVYDFYKMIKNLKEELRMEKEV